MTTDELEGVAPEIWEMMLGLTLVPAPEDAHWDDETRSITALVTVVGEDWSGVVSIECTTAAARRFAASMFGADDPDDMPLEEVRDATAELANMTGGNIKNLAPGAPRLGIPTVTEGVGYTIALPRTVPVRTLVYRCDDDLVRLVLYQRR